MAEKLGKTVLELLNSLTESELMMWKHYYSEPRDEEKMSLQIAQLTSVLANVNGNKTNTSDFILDFSSTEAKKESIEERVKKSMEKLSKDLKKI